MGLGWNVEIYIVFLIFHTSDQWIWKEQVGENILPRAIFMLSWNILIFAYRNQTFCNTYKQTINLIKFCYSYQNSRKNTTLKGGTRWFNGRKPLKVSIHPWNESCTWIKGMKWPMSEWAVQYALSHGHSTSLTLIKYLVASPKPVIDLSRLLLIFPPSPYYPWALIPVEIGKKGVIWAWTPKVLTAPSPFISLFCFTKEPPY